MRFYRILPLVFLAFVLWSLATGAPAMAQSAPPEASQSAQVEETQAAPPSGLGAEGHFKAGVEAFQKRDFKQARASFHESLRIDDLNPVVLFNLGMVELRSGKLGLTLAMWRKALVVSPSYAPARQGEKWAKSQLKRPEIPHEPLLWESFRKIALVPVELGRYLLLTALTLLAAGWLILRHMGQRRMARLEEKPMPGFPISAVVCGFLLLTTGLLSAAKAYDSRVVRGTVLEEKVEVRSSPSANGTPLFELYEGLEVIVRQSVDGWRQVTYPGGTTGWIPQQAVFATTDKVGP
jgi:tetratricopeptide (TPR) repeat protein